MTEKEEVSNLLHKTKHFNEKVPESEMEGEFHSMTMTITTILNLNATIIQINEVPLFRDAPKGEINKVFDDKCKECKKICDFSSEQKDEQAKKDKKLHLQDFSRFFSTARNFTIITPENMNHYFDMVVKNINRAFPKVPKSIVDCGDQIFDAAWPHLQLIYEGLLKFFQGCPANLSVQHQTIVPALISCCCSPDGRERMAVRDILKNFYSKSHNCRSQIIRISKSHFKAGLCSAELLDFFIRVIDAFKTPLSPHHKSFFQDAILYLHTTNNFFNFCLPLFQCINHFIVLDNFLFKSTIYFLYKHWPESNVKKQILFFSEIEGLLINFSNLVELETAEYLFKLIANAVQQPNLELSEAAMNVILGIALSKILPKFMNNAQSILVPALYKTGKKHWNNAIREDAIDVIDQLSQLSPEAFQKAKEVIASEKKKLSQEKEINAQNWKKIFAKAKKRDQSISEINTSFSFF